MSCPTGLFIQIIKGVSNGDAEKVAYIVTDHAANMRAAQKMLLEQEGLK